MSRAITSLPLPDSPWRKTVASVAATRTAAVRTRCHAGDGPIAPASGQSLHPLVELAMPCLIAPSCDSHERFNHQRKASAIARWYVPYESVANTKVLAIPSSDRSHAAGLL